jgi:hypothetical protein
MYGGVDVIGACRDLVTRFQIPAHLHVKRSSFRAYPRSSVFLYLETLSSRPAIRGPSVDSLCILLSTKRNKSVA